MSIAPQQSPPSPVARQLKTPVAVIVSRFPVVTETFILRELDALEQQGQPVTLVPLMKETRQLTHQAAIPWVERALYTPWFSLGMLNANIRIAAQAPGKYARTLWLLLRTHWQKPGILLRTLALFPKAASISESLRHSGISHVHAQFATYPTTLAWIIRQFSGINYSITIHAHDLFVHQLMLKQKLQDAVFIRCISEYNRLFLSRHYGAAIADKTTVIHVGIDSPSYTKKQEHSDPHQTLSLLCVAALKPYKGIDLLLDACSELNKAGYDFHCSIVGNGPLRETLLKKRDALQLGKQVDFPGALEQEQVRELMQTSDIFVMSSIVAADGQMEGIPVALMEAMASSCAVVAPSLSGIPELITDGRNGLLYEPNRLEALFTSLSSLIDNPALRRRLAEHAPQRVKEAFSLPVIAGELAEALSRVNKIEPLPGELVEPLSTSPLADCLLARSGAAITRPDSCILPLLATCEDKQYSLILKLHRNQNSADQARIRAHQEFTILDNLSGKLPSDTSTVIPRTASPFFLSANALLMERLEGRGLDQLIRQQRFHGSELESWFRSAGIWLHHYQHIPWPNGLQYASDYRIPKLRQRCSRQLASLQDIFTTAESDRIEAQLAKTGLQSGKSDVPTHGDFWPGNLICGNRQLGVIDLEGAGIGHPYAEAAVFLIQSELFFAAPLLGKRFKDLFETFFNGFEHTSGPGDADTYVFLQITTAVDRLYRHHSGDPRNRLAGRHLKLLKQRARGLLP
jgi:glycosyltransferase involved in cell wall biosynthesis